MTGSRFLASAVLLFVCTTLTGCGWAVRGLTPPERPNATELLATFDGTSLNQSTAGDVLSNVPYPTLQFVMQGQNTVGISGPKPTRNRTWLTVVSFGESLAASGKYFSLINDKPQAFMYSRLLRARFDAEKIVTPEVLTKNYPDEESKNIAVLRDILDGFDAAAREVKLSDPRARSSSMAAHRLLNEILVRLKTAPIEASLLADLKGMPFDDATMGKGRLRMVIEGDIVKLKVIVGSVSADFARIPGVKNM
jgi:hypothetical protein